MREVAHTGRTDSLRILTYFVMKVGIVDLIIIYQFLHKHKHKQVEPGRLEFV